MAGLIELALVLGLLVWFWRSQTGATREAEPREPGATPPPAPPVRREPPPQH